uniref:60S ribosomal protein L36 n=1 Tax=Paramoeba aestuarina TaxID=180227 RepID=A0A6U3BMB3_9EUKA|mmetsp:Transcript_30869/g.48082  ORF Transcript_30869/g.48082 Transcript_30869/m.48082 type:complete len:108 (+) Transcript_30869:56-379(+)
MTKEKKQNKYAPKAIALGVNRGHPVKKRELPARPSKSKAKLGKRQAVARDVIRDVAGFAPYEKRAMELLRNRLDKRALRYVKKRIGSHRRALRKREELAGAIRRKQA